MMQLVILSAGGHAREIADVVEAINAIEGGRYRLLGFIDDDSAKHGLNLSGVPVLGDFGWFDTVDSSDVWAVCGAGRSSLRHKLARRAEQRGLSFCTLIHPASSVTRSVEVGIGTVIMPGSVLTNHIRLGDHVFVGPGVTVGHDTRVDDFASLYPGAHLAGNVHIGMGCELGIGSVVIQNRTIGEWTIVGAGAAVIEDLPANCTAVGAPARVVKQNEIRLA